MGSEKLAAAGASGMAVALQLQNTNVQLMARGFQQGLAMLGAMGSLGASRTVGQALSRQATLLGAAQRAGRTQARLSGDTARLMQAALKPVHAASTANARRLVKTSRR